MIPFPLFTSLPGISELFTAATTNEVVDKHFVGGIAGTRCLVLEGVRTNLHENSYVSSSTSGYGTTTGAVISRLTTLFAYGTNAALRVNISSGGTDRGVYTVKNSGSRMDVTASSPYCFWAMVYGSDESGQNLIGTAMKCRIAWYNSGGSVISNTDVAFTLRSGWQMVYATATSPGTAVTARGEILKNTSNTGYYWVGTVSFTNTPYPAGWVLTTSGSAAAVADGRYAFQFNYVPQPMFFYVKMIEGGTGRMTDEEDLWNSEYGLAQPTLWCRRSFLSGPVRSCRSARPGI